MKTRSNAPIAISRDAVRRAFSYFEKATAAQASAHIGQARQALDALRVQMERDIAASGEALQSVLREQSTLGERLAAGRVKPTKANAQNREIASRIEQLRLRVMDLNRLLAARSSADLGGFLDLPIEDYEGRGAPPHHAKPAGRRGFLSAFVEDEPTIAGIELKPTRLGLIVWATGLALALVASLCYLGLVKWGGTLDLQLTGGGPNGLITVTIQNNGNAPVEVRAPLPEGGIASSEDSAGRRLCGLRAWSREDGGKEFRMVPASVECWVQTERKLEEHPPISVPPRLPVQVMFDPATVRGDKTLRIALVRSDGTVLMQRDIDLR